MPSTWVVQSRKVLREQCWGSAKLPLSDLLELQCPWNSRLCAFFKPNPKRMANHTGNSKSSLLLRCPGHGWSKEGMKKMTLWAVKCSSFELDKTLQNYTYQNQGTKSNEKKRQEKKLMKWDAKKKNLHWREKNKMAGEGMKCREIEQILTNWSSLKSQHFFTFMKSQRPRPEACPEASFHETYLCSQSINCWEYF